MPAVQMPFIGLVPVVAVHCAEVTHDRGEPTHALARFASHCCCVVQVALTEPLFGVQTPTRVDVHWNWVMHARDGVVTQALPAFWQVVCVTQVVFTTTPLFGEFVQAVWLMQLVPRLTLVPVQDVGVDEPVVWQELVSEFHTVCDGDPVGGHTVF